MVDASAAERQAIRAEVERIHESAVYSNQGQFEAAKLWRSLHWTLGAVAAGLSTAAAVVTFGSGLQVLSGTLAVLAAMTVAVLTGARPDRLAEHAQRCANDYVALRNDARRLRDIRIPSDDLPSLRQALEQLAHRASQLDHASDPIPAVSRKAAQRNIASGGQSFEVDTA